MREQRPIEVQPYLRKAHFYETDQMGIIHHANYVHWMEEARVDFMEQMGFGYDKATEHGIDFVLMGITCEYKGMVRFGETVCVRVSFAAYHPVMLTVRYEMTDAETGELRFTGESKHCTFDSKKQRPAALSRELPELHALFETQYRAGVENHPEESSEG